MKTLILSLLCFSALFANYAYTGQNSGKIDMHGGKVDKLTNSNGFSKSSFSLSSTFSKKEKEKKVKEETKNKKFIPLDKIEKIDSTK